MATIQSNQETCEHIMPITEQNRREYLLAEYNTLRDEIKLKLTQKYMTERVTIIGLALLYGVAATLDHYDIDEYVKNLKWIIWWVPPILILLGWSSNFVNDQGIKNASQYIRETIEPEFCRQAHKVHGWEHYLNTTGRWYNKIANVAFTMCFVAAIAIAIYMTRCH